MEKCQLTVYQSRFWRNFGVKKYLITSRTKQKGLHYAIEGYIQNFKIHTEGNKLKFGQLVFSPAAQSDPQYTGLHFFLSRCGLGKGMKYTPFCSLSGYRLSMLHVPQAHRLTMFIFYFTQTT